MKRPARAASQFIRGQWWWLSYLTIFSLAFLVFLYLQASPNFADPDSFYHAKMALLIRQQGVVTKFPWLQLTVLGQNYTDQHLLYHVALIPFVAWFSPLVGLKLATVFFGATLITVVYWVMRQWRVRWPLFFALILLFSRPFSFRMSLAKAPSTSLIFLIVGLNWIFHFHWRRLAALAFAYVWYYGGFALLGVAALVHTVVSLAQNRWSKGPKSHQFVQKVLATASLRSRHNRRQYLNVKVLAAVAGGLLAGVVINPYFPHNLAFYYHQLINIGVINFQHVIGVGGEWYPYGFGELVANAAFATILILLAVVGIISRPSAQSKQSLTLGLLTIIFFFLTLKSRRYVEYYVPMAVLFSAFSISDALRGKTGQEILTEARRMFWHSQLGRYGSAFVLGALLFAFGYIAGRDLSNEKNDLQGGFRIGQYQAASQWLAEHTPVVSRVVHSDWDEFPLLFYYNTHNTYIVGLDPTFLYKANQDIYWTWANITLGKFDGDVYQAVTKTLGARYVFIAHGHQVMERYFQDHRNFVQVYTDAEATIYQASNLSVKK
ncbi:MAG: hypothetical protein HY092_00665 [Candidatus Kerfeldbacteria bacterium]|nr:hypothetical protein [Candidatus Kerfeldbacteria bacterium]